MFNIDKIMFKFDSIMTFKNIHSDIRTSYFKKLNKNIYLFYKIYFNDDCIFILIFYKKNWFEYNQSAVLLRGGIYKINRTEQ